MSLVRDVVFADVSTRQEWQVDVRRGKMFGALVVTGPDEALSRCPGMLHDVDGAKVLFAYSGQILGRSDWPGYVPAIFDYLQPDGYFKRHEAEITELNSRLSAAQRSGTLATAKNTLAAVKAKAAAEVAAYRNLIREGRGIRTVQEAQFQNAELRRIKKRVAEAVAAAQSDVDALEAEILNIKEERRQRSDILQRWLFTQHRLALPDGRQRSLLQVFTDYVRHTGSRQPLPPSGTGECCAPRLLHYANGHGLTPVALAEFWYGESPKGEVRHHGQFYEPCQSKCVPILWAMEGQPAPAGTPSVSRQPASLEVLYEDESLIAVNKPAGLLSVPGRTGQPNVEGILRAMRPEIGFLRMAHRLDMDTSGIIVAAKSQAAYTVMQALFAAHGEVQKQYVAVLACPVGGEDGPMSGEISLPLSSDYLSRPRQRVDYDGGKRAVTRYEFMPPLADEAIEEIFGSVLPRRSSSGNMAFRAVLLTPLTGRTHQLRVHCAHPDGLGMPILGDALYGNVAAPRMFLHAWRLMFPHPTTKETLTITIPLCCK